MNMLLVERLSKVIILTIVAIVVTTIPTHSSRSEPEKRIYKRNVAQSRKCPDLCKVTLKNSGCSDISILYKRHSASNSSFHMNVADVCESYLSETFATTDDCVAKCKNCSARRMTRSCNPNRLGKTFRRCKLPPETGPCRGYFVMWYFDYKMGRCHKMVYGGCRGNTNRFKTELQCFLRCGILSIVDPPVPGNYSLLRDEL